MRPRRKQVDNNYWWMYGPEGTGWYNRHDPPFWPANHEYKVETLTAGWDCSVSPPIPYGTGTNPPTPFPVGKYALTNYGGGYNPTNPSQTPPIPAAITYIQLITDYTQLMPGFVNCLAFRLAQELSISVTESQTKFESMREMYRDSLNSAEAQNESSDYVHDEDGSESWVRAGRNADRWW